MSHAFVKSHFHVVFATRQRRCIIPKERQPDLWAYMAGICKNHGITPIVIGGMSDHIHALFHLPPTMALSKALALLKANSSRWLNELGNVFAWQEGYGAFSVSVSNTPVVIRYIREQEAHHRKMTFETEFLGLLRKHRVDFDPQHVFD
jgi:putative transposase